MGNAGVAMNQKAGSSNLSGRTVLIGGNALSDLAFLAVLQLCYGRECGVSAEDLLWSSLRQRLINEN